MLGNLITARFASYHSPLREQRELCFAKKKDAGRGQGPGGSQPEKGNDSIEGRTDGVTDQVDTNLSAIRGNLLSVSGLSLSETANSLETQQILRDMELPDRRSNVRGPSRLEQSQNRLTKARDEGERREAAEALLREPEMLLRAVMDLEAAADRFREAERTLNSAAPGLRGKIEKMLDAADESREDLQQQLYREIEAEAPEVFAQYIDRIDRTREAAGEERLLPRERAGELRQLCRRFVLSIQADVQRERIGRLTVPTLEAQSQSLRAALDLQIREHAKRQGALELRKTAEALVIPAADIQHWAREAGLRQPDVVDMMQVCCNPLGMMKLLENNITVRQRLGDERYSRLLGHIERATLALRDCSFTLMAETRLGPVLEDLRRYYRDPSVNDILARRGIDPSPTPDSAAFIAYSREAIERLRELREDETTEAIAAEARERQHDAETWAFQTANRIRTLTSTHQEHIDRPTVKRMSEIMEIVGQYGSNEDSIRQLREGRGKDNSLLPPLDESGVVTPLTLTDEERQKIDTFLGMLENPSLLALSEQQRTELKRRTEQEKRSRETPEGRIDRICEETRSELNSVLDAIAPAAPGQPTDDPDNLPKRGLRAPFTHEICNSGVVPLPGILRDRERAALITLRTSQGKTDDNTLTSLLAIRDDVRSLRAFYDKVTSVRLREENAVGERWDARYDRSTGEIVINTAFRENRQGSHREFLIKHETGHLILHALEESGVLPFRLAEFHESRREMTGESGRTFPALLVDLQDEMDQYRPYVKDVTPAGKNQRFSTRDGLRAKRGNKELDVDAMNDELLNRHADWMREGRPVNSPRFNNATELELFRILDREGGQRAVSEPEVDIAEGGDVPREGRETRPRRKDQRYATHADEGPAETPSNTASDGFDMKQTLTEIERNIYTTKTFIKAYQAEMPEVTAKLQVLVDEATASHKEFKQLFNDGGPAGTTPEENGQIQRLASELRQFTEKEMRDKVREIDAGKLDTTGAKPKALTGLGALLQGIKFVSINDVVKLWNDTLEDIKSIHKRRQDRTLKEVGGVITKGLSGLPLPGVLGAYTRGLNAYHERRYSGAEVEAADKWKDGMKNLDTHELLHFLHGTRNKDAVRGIITLLTERGEMDWNDDDVWRTLNALPGGKFKMPIGPCKRDDVLRDTWLRKMVSDIWQDKELYYHWRTHNDSSTDSGKKGFTTSADQLMNIAGGAENELAKQLRMQERSVATHTSPPEDVKPHFYEEIIEYAIRNGKLTMEAKMYYLVRGVASGILSIDRLRALAGEKGDILSQFPFLDYFYKKNNTLAEIQALANHLTERDHGHDTYKPGVKTTLWLHLEVAREESVQMRISKGTSRGGGQKIDHEDVPFFIPQLDIEARRSMLTHISGGQQKMSPEALKNLYVGDSSSLKVAGLLAKMDEEGKARFTKIDARKFVQNLVSYVDFDNIVTRNGYDSDTRAVLGSYLYDTQAPSGDEVHTVRQYREQLNKLVRDVFDRYREQITTHPDFKRAVDGTPPLTLDQILPQSGGPRQHPKAIAEHVFKVMPTVLELLENAVKADMNPFKEVLKEYGTGAHGKVLYDESGSAGKMTVRKVREAIKARENADVHTGNGHGHDGGHGH